MSRSRQTGLMVGAVVLAVVLLAIDNLFDRLIDEDPAFGRFLLFTALCLVAAAGVVLFGVPRAQRASGETNRLSQAGFVIGLVALVTIIVFFTALPIVLGAGAFVLGRLGEERAGQREEETGGQQRQDESQQAGQDPADVSVGERASQGWVAAIMGALAAAACVILFVVEFVRT